MAMSAPDNAGDSNSPHTEFGRGMDIGLCETADSNDQDIQLMCIFRDPPKGIRCPSPLPRGVARPMNDASTDKDYNSYNNLKKR